MADEKFCSAENYSVLIPYSDLVKLVDVAKKVESIELQYSRLLDQPCFRFPRWPYCDWYGRF